MTALDRPLRILVSGSRRWTDQAVIALSMGAWIEEQGHTIGSVWPVPVVVHGGAHGADMLAGRVARNWGWREEIHAADWDTHGRAAGHVRNHEMVKAGADVVLAFPLGESRGTRGCMAAAERAGIPVIDCAAAVPR